MAHQVSFDECEKSLYFPFLAFWLFMADKTQTEGFVWLWSFSYDLTPESILFIEPVKSVYNFSASHKFHINRRYNEYSLLTLVFDISNDKHKVTWKFYWLLS